MQIRLWLIGFEDFFIVRHADLLKSGPQAHPLCQEITVLLRVLHPVPVFVCRLLKQIRQIKQGWICHVPVFRIMDLLPGLQAADEGKKAVVRLVFK